MSLQTFDPPARVPGQAVGGVAALASAAAAKRRAALVEHVICTARLGKPVETDEGLGRIFGVMPNTIDDAFARLRREGLVETNCRKFKLPGADGMTSERRVRARTSRDAAWSPWSAWPTAGKPAPVQRPRDEQRGVPPAFWSTRREKVSSAHTAPDVVEQAKDVVRRFTGSRVCHLWTINNPDRVFVPSRKPPGDASVVVGEKVMSEVALVALAGRLQAAADARRATLQ